MTQEDIEEIISYQKPRHSLEIEDEERIAKAIHHKHQESLKELRSVWTYIQEGCTTDQDMIDAINNLAKKDKW